MRANIYTLLRRSEIYLKTDMVYLTKGGFWLGLAQIISSGSSFILSIVFAHFLTLEAYGNYKYVLSIAAILSSFTLTGLGTSVTNGVSRGKEGVLQHAFKEALKWSMPVVITGVCVAEYYSYHNLQNIATAILIATIATPIINSSSLFAAFLSGKKDFKTTTYYWSIINIFAVMCVVITTIATRNFVYSAAAYFIGNAIGNLFFYYYTIKLFKPNKITDSTAVNYGRHITIINLLNIFSSQLDKVLLFHFLGPIQLAIYSFSIAVPDQIKAILGAIPRLAHPKFANHNIATIKQSITSKMIKMSVISLGITFIYIIISPMIYEHLFPNYIASIKYSQLIALGLVAISGSLPLTALQAHGEKKLLYIHAFILNGTRLLSMVVCIPLFGLTGAVIAILIGRFVSLITPTMLLLKIPDQRDGVQKQN